MGAYRSLMGFSPYLILGEKAKGGLMVPSAKASDRAMYGPRGVAYDGSVLAVADTGNHRILIWFSLPTEDHQKADVVLGQKDFFSDSPNAGGDPKRGLYMPCGIAIHNKRLFVADAWNHRILIWETIPETNFTPPDYVIGQPNLTTTSPSKGKDAKNFRFFWCYNFGFIGDYFLVCDTGNRRIVGWKGIPDFGQEPDILLNEEGLFMWPHAICGDENKIFIADAGNHRVLGWKGINNLYDSPSVILGQKNITETYENPYEPQSASTLRFPYGISMTKDILCVADTANNRVLIWNPVPLEGTFLPAKDVLGQYSFTENGENRWESVKKDTLCWPYSVYVYENLIFIADTGNNRVVIWKRD